MWSYGCWHDTQSISFIFDEIWSFYRTKLLSRASFLRQVDATVHNLDWPSTTWIDRLHLGPIVYIRDKLSISGTNCLYPGPTVYIWRSATGCDRDRPSTYKGPRPLIYESPRPVTYKGCDWLQTKVATGYIRRVATNYMRKSATRLVRFKATNCMRFDYNWSAQHSPTQDKTIG